MRRAENEDLLGRVEQSEPRIEILLMSLGTIRGIVLLANPSGSLSFSHHALAAFITSGPAVDVMVLNLMSGSTWSSLITPFKILK